MTFTNAAVGSGIGNISKSGNTVTYIPPLLFSGNYADLSNKPTIPTNNSQLTNGANYLTSSSAANTYAPLASPAFTGTPTINGANLGGTSTLGGLTDVTLPSQTTTLPTANVSFDFRNATINTATKKVSINGTIVGEIKQDTVGNLATTQSATNGLVGSLNEYFSFDVSKWKIKQAASSSFSIEIYFKMQRASGRNYNGIFSAFNGTVGSGNSTSQNIQIARHQNTDKFFFRTNSSSLHPAGNSHAGWDGNYGHMVCIYNGASQTKSAYMNGTLLGGTLTDTYDYAGQFDNMIIGRTAYTSENDVESIRFFRHYNSVLTQTEITALYNAKDITTTTTGLGDGEIIAYDTTTSKWVNTNVLKSCITDTFFNLNSELRLNNLAGNSGQILQSNGTGSKPTWVSLSTYAPLLSPAFTGTPTINGASLGGVASPSTTTTVTFVPATPLQANLDFRQAGITWYGGATNNIIIGGATVGTGNGTLAEITVPTTSQGLSTGVNSYVAINPINFNTNFTIELYFKLPSNSGTSQSFNAVFSAYDGGLTSAGASTSNIGIERYANTNKLQFYTRHSGVFSIATTVNDVAGFDGTFGHMVVIHDSAQTASNCKTVVVNGQAQGLNISGSDPIFRAGTRTNNVIGKTPYQDNGVEDVKYIRFYNRVLTASEISTLYQYRDTPGTSTTATTDVTGLVLKSTNSTGTATGWVNPLPQALTTASSPTFAGLNVTTGLHASEIAIPNMKFSWSGNSTGGTALILSPNTNGNIQIGHPTQGVHGYVNLNVWGNMFLNGVHHNNNTWSDDRIKSHEEILTGKTCIDYIKQIVPKKYKKYNTILTKKEEETLEAGGDPFKDKLTGNPADDSKYKKPTVEYGFIAQEIEKIPGLQEIVTTGDKDNVYQLDYKCINTLLLGAVKDLIKSVETLEARVKTLENK